MHTAGPNRHSSERPAKRHGVKIAKKAVKGAAILDRDGGLSGYLFQVGPESFLKWPANHPHEYNDAFTKASIEMLNRIVEACARSAGGMYENDRFCIVRNEPRIQIATDARLLLDDRFRSAVAISADLMKVSGFKLMLEIEARELNTPDKAAYFSRALGELSSHALDLILKDPVCDGSTLRIPKVFEIPLTAICVSPAWLGIGYAHGSISLTTYQQRVSKLNVLIHRSGRKCVYSNIRTPWQASFLHLLPSSHYVPVSSGDDIYV